MINSVETKILIFKFFVFGFFFLIFNLFFSFCSIAQEKRTDTLTVIHQSLSPQIHSPRKAAIFSAVMPGLGQAYNKKYWKMPIVYAGFATLGYFIFYNYDKYTFYRNAYIVRTDNDTTTNTPDNLNIYQNDGLLTLKNYYRRNMEFSIVVTTMLYLLNIIDAYVDAHLMTFDINDNLSLQVEPFYDFTFQRKKVNGINLTLNF